MPADTKNRPETRGRPTLYKGIRMRSRLEADFAATIGGGGEVWEYEPECFAADGVQWLPDFRLSYPPSKVRWYVEVKPVQLLQVGSMPDIVGKIDAILRQMSVAWESEPDACLVLALHRYGRPLPDFEIRGAPGMPWGCIDNLSPNSMLLTWPGMGQQAALPTAPESARSLREATSSAR